MFVFTRKVEQNVPVIHQTLHISKSRRPLHQSNEPPLIILGAGAYGTYPQVSFLVTI